MNKYHRPSLSNVVAEPAALTEESIECMLKTIFDSSTVNLRIRPSYLIVNDTIANLPPEKLAELEEYLRDKLGDASISFIRLPLIPE